MIIILITTIVIILAHVIIIITDNSLEQSHYHGPDLQTPPLPLQSHSKAVKVHSADLGFDVSY